ncbi:MAG: hypothetical protein QM733_15750 [Ilumatobacteraceae bacterium]
MEIVKTWAGKAWRWYRGLRWWWQVLIGILVLSVITGPFLQKNKDDGKAATGATIPTTVASAPSETVRATTSTVTVVTTTTAPPSTVATTTTSAAPTTTTSTSTTTTIPATTTTLAEADRVRAAVEDELQGGDLTAVEMPDLAIAPDRITVRARSSGNLTEGLTKDGARLVVFSALRGLVEANVDPTVTKFRIVVNHDLVNQFGEVTDTPVIDVVYERATAERIQFDNISFKTILTLPTVDLHVHPAFAKDDGS